MSEAMIARTVAEAAVGDLLWVRTDRWRACDWLLWPVRKVGRVYAFVGEREADHTWVKIPREHPYDANRAVMGWHQRAVQHYRHMLQCDDTRRRIGEADLGTLKTVAFALGLDGPPDFSVVPLAARPTPPQDGGSGEAASDG